VVVAILLFEKRRAQRIERDTRRAARAHLSVTDGYDTGETRRPSMSNHPEDPRADQAASTTDPDEEATGVEIGSTDGEGSTFEPEEDPEGHSDRT
jgi:hypothetical protein